jgi:predicted GNAT superfamily acetyltransferase
MKAGKKTARRIGDEAAVLIHFESSSTYYTENPEV